MYIGHHLIVNLSFHLKGQLEAVDRSLYEFVCMALNINDNIIAMGSFNNNINKDEGMNHDELDVFCDIFNLTNLVKLKHFTLIAINQKLTYF